ncbi:hypothetical protein GZL_04772 [Streptomyces sp. 769]|nr:hypothetical protein GZL_04772 [Streptomyces sp. 769]
MAPPVPRQSGPEPHRRGNTDHRQHDHRDFERLTGQPHAPTSPVTLERVLAFSPAAPRGTTGGSGQWSPEKTGASGNRIPARLTSYRALACSFPPRDVRGRGREVRHNRRNHVHVSRETTCR